MSIIFLKMFSQFDGYLLFVTSPSFEAITPPGDDENCLCSSVSRSMSVAKKRIVTFVYIRLIFQIIKVLRISERISD